MQFGRHRPGRAGVGVALLIGVTLAVCACGGSSAARSSGSSRPTALYTLTMTGSAETPKGPAAGRGVAIIAFHGASELCYRFAHLHGFTDATAAHIHTGSSGHSGPVLVTLSTGPKLHHRGCLRVSPTISGEIARSPSSYYVNVHSGQYPGGAIRAQL